MSRSKIKVKCNPKFIYF